MKYWSVNRDAYNGSLWCLYNWVVFHPLYNLTNQFFFHCSSGQTFCKAITIRILLVLRYSPFWSFYLYIFWANWLIQFPNLNCFRAFWGRISDLFFQKKGVASRVWSLFFLPSYKERYWHLLCIHPWKLTWRAPKWWFGKGDSLKKW